MKWYQSNCRKCGAVAFYINEKPYPGMQPAYEMVINSDMTPAQMYDRAECKQCGTNFLLGEYAVHSEDAIEVMDKELIAKLDEVQRNR
jgi:hypothetical protein